MEVFHLLIQCTKKLLTELKIKPDPVTEEQQQLPLLSWHANLVTMARKKTVVLMNDSNRYVLVLHGLKAKDLSKIGELIVQAIRETWLEEGIKEEVIEEYLSRSTEITFTTTKDRKSVARLNKACEYAGYFEHLLIPSAVVQPAVGKKGSRVLAGDGKDFIDPYKELYRDLKELVGVPIFDGQAVVLHVTLNLENHKVWRRVVVPRKISFPELHSVLQKVFDWSDYHLHEFQIFKSQPTAITNAVRNKERKPTVNLVCTEEALSYDVGVPQKMETDEILADYLPAEIVYIYDFGDGWEHHIVVEKFVDDYEYNHAMCLDGEGRTPPEDVGGEPGYESFLAIMSDPNHPDHKYMMEWAEDQGYSDFNMKMINHILSGASLR